MRHLLLLSGPLSIGKSAVARVLMDRHGFRSVRTGPYLARLAEEQGKTPDRTTLQAFGDALDVQTDFTWIVEEVAVASDQENWLIDSVRKMRQVEHFRARFPHYVYHVHLSAPESLLRARYQARLEAGGDYAGNICYETAINHPNEVSARSLAARADIVVQVEGKAPEEIATIIMEGLGGNSHASGGSR